MRKFSLLYVDDEESNLRVFKDTFRRKYKIFTATSAKEGIEILNNEKVDLILSDQRMPEMSGVEFLKYTLEKFPSRNRILITGYSDFDAIENAINQAHVFQYVQKPWSEENLQNTIDHALKIYELELENQKHKQELIKAKEKAEESDRLKTEFINNMSHEIRTPLNGILGFTQVLNMIDINDKEELKNYTKQIQSCSEQLTNIIDDILEISSLHAKQVEINEEKVNINELLNQKYKNYYYKANNNNTPLELNTTLYHEKSYIYADAEKIGKVLDILLNNALKFTESGFIKMGCKLNTDLSKIIFYVKDSGVGVSPDKQEEIFGRFKQEEKSLTRKYGGLGLGLAIAREIANLLNGEISLKSEKYKGSTFYLTIDYKPVSCKETEEKKEGKIVIAEDIEPNFIYLKTLLELVIKVKGEIIHAKTGSEVVEICKNEEDVDLVFMDLEMDEKNGYEATKEIKHFKPELPIIAQSAYINYYNKQKAKEAGCDDFLEKPIKVNLIQAVCEKYL